MKLERFSEAEVIYRDLIHRNHENYDYHRNLERCLNLDSESALMIHYKELEREYPRSHVIRRKPLTFTSGNKGSLITSYLGSSL